jgi:thiaminase/transcriptional activator TenA
VLCRDYIVQDHKYLEVFAKNLSLLSAKANGSKASAMFAQSAVHVVTVENSLHHNLLKSWGVEAEELDSAVMQPACLAYTNYLQAVVQSQPFYEGARPFLLLESNVPPS